MELWSNISRHYTSRSYPQCLAFIWYIQVRNFTISLSIFIKNIGIIIKLYTGISSFLCFFVLGHLNFFIIIIEIFLESLQKYFPFLYNRGGHSTNIWMSPIRKDNFLKLFHIYIRKKYFFSDNYIDIFRVFYIFLWNRFLKHIFSLCLL